MVGRGTQVGLQCLFKAFCEQVTPGVLRATASAEQHRLHCHAGSTAKMSSECNRGGMTADVREPWITCHGCGFRASYPFRPLTILVQSLLQSLDTAVEILCTLRILLQNLESGKVVLYPQMFLACVALLNSSVVRIVELAMLIILEVGSDYGGHFRLLRKRMDIQQSTYVTAQLRTL